MHEANTGGGKDSSGPPHWPAVFGVFARGMSLASSISKGMAATTTIMYVPYDDLERRAARAAAMHPGDPGRADSTNILQYQIKYGARHLSFQPAHRLGGMWQQFAPCVWMGAAFTAL